MAIYKESMDKLATHSEEKKNEKYTEYEVKNFLDHSRTSQYICSVDNGIIWIVLNHGWQFLQDECDLYWKEYLFNLNKTNYRGKERDPNV